VSSNGFTIASARSRTETAEVVKARDAALARKSELLTQWTRSEDEAAVTELSKLSSRAEVYAAKLASMTVDLDRAQSDLAELFKIVSVSFVGLSSALETFLLKRAEAVLSALIIERC
jgi:hypothetical protein